MLRFNNQVLFHPLKYLAGQLQYYSNIAIYEHSLVTGSFIDGHLLTIYHNFDDRVFIWHLIVHF